jgi:small subunit ribosomal protein S13
MKELVRIAQTDIPGKRKLYPALSKIKGVNFSFSNAVCNALNVDKTKQIGMLSEQEIKQIEDFIKNPEALPPHLLNRRKDRETGKDMHVIGTDLRFRQEFDIRLLKKIKCYRGMRHASNLPVRGQRTKGNFRRGTTVGVVKKKIQQAAKSAKGGKK